MAKIPGTGGDHDTGTSEPAIALTATLLCRGCGFSIARCESRCPHCLTANVGNPQVAQAQAARVQWCALAAYVCCFGFALVAWWLARRDLAEICAGQRHPSARRLTETARDLALWNLGLHCLGGIMLVLGLAIWVWVEIHRPIGQ